MNYTEIQDQIRSILNRGTSLDSEIPIWIGYAESQIKSELRLVATYQTITSTLLAGDDSIAYPSMLEPDALTYDLSDYVEPIFPVAYLPPSDDATCAPEFWATDGVTIRFDSKADQDYTISIQGYGGLDIANTQNWIATEAPDCYIYGALMYSVPKTKQDNGYSNFFDLALKKARRLSNKRRGLNNAVLRTDIGGGNTFNIHKGH